MSARPRLPCAATTLAATTLANYDSANMFALFFYSRKTSDNCFRGNLTNHRPGNRQLSETSQHRVERLTWSAGQVVSLQPAKSIRPKFATKRRCLRVYFRKRNQQLEFLDELSHTICLTWQCATLNALNAQRKFRKADAVACVRSNADDPKTMTSLQTTVTTTY